MELTHKQMPITDCNEMPTEARAAGFQVASNWSGWHQGALQDWCGVGYSESLSGQQRGNGSSGLVSLTEIAV